MATIRNHQSIIMEASNCRNITGYTLNPSDQRHVIAVNSTNTKMPSGLFEIYPDNANDLLYNKRQMTLMEMENAKLLQAHRQVSEECNQVKQKYEMLKQQIASMSNNNVAGITFQANASYMPHTDSKINEIQQQLTSFVNIYNKDRSQMHALVNAVSKMEVYCEEIKVRLDRIEDNSLRGWVDVHDYREDQNAQILRDTTSPLYNRRDYNPTTGNVALSDISDDETVDASETSRVGYPPISCNGELTPRENAGGNNPSSASVSASISLDRRHSDSTTTNTIESGYCDDREDIIFDSNADQGVGHNRHNGASGETRYNTEAGESNTEGPNQVGDINKDCNTIRKTNDNTSTVIMSTQDDDGDIEFVGRYIAPKKSGSGIPNSSVPESGISVEVGREEQKQKQAAQTESGRVRMRRASIFSRLAEGSRSATHFDMDFDDSSDDYEQNVSRNNSKQAPRPSLDPEISSLNGIFEDSDHEISATRADDSNDSTTQSIKRKKTATNSSEQQKRIRGISKAPVKQEPGTLTACTGEGSQQTTTCPTSPHAPALNTSSTTFMQTLRNIKKERVAHAIDGYVEADNLWKCICGHKTTTKNGMKLHVKHMGTEEARYMCPWQDCDGRFLYPYLVRNHLVRDHKDNTIPDKLYGCEKCYRVFYDQNNFKTHTNDRNEICKLTPRRRLHHVPAFSRSSVQVMSVIPTGTGTPKRPSIIVTL